MSVPGNTVEEIEPNIYLSEAEIDRGGERQILLRFDQRLPELFLAARPIRNKKKERKKQERGERREKREESRVVVHQ